MKAFLFSLVAVLLLASVADAGLFQRLRDRRQGCGQPVRTLFHGHTLSGCAGGSCAVR